MSSVIDEPAAHPLELERIGPFEYRRQPVRLPDLTDGRDRRHHAVAILGGGPVGMAVALGLASHGVRSVILEADESVCIGSRAACISRRSLEILGRLGVAGQFLAKGLPWSSGRSFWRTEEIFRFEMPNDPGERLPPMINLQQYYIEQFLFDEINRRNAATPGLIDLRWGTEVTALDVQSDRVGVTARTSRGTYELDADWLLACDGGQSFARKALNLPMHGAAYDGRYVIIDIELPSEHPVERRAWFDPPWNPGSTVLMHCQPDDIWRIDYQVRAQDDLDRALEPERVHDFVQRHLDAIGEGHLPWKPVWTSIYRAGAMTLESYRHGRVLFAGNAAHAMPIFGVRGLNSGIDDADNLAWKLAYVIQGRARDALLDSYSGERLQAFHSNAANAMRSTEFMSPPSRGFDLMREAALTLAAAHPAIASLVNPRQTSAIDYADSALSSASDDLDAGPAPGSVLPDPKLSDGTYLSARLAAHGFSAIVFVHAPGAALGPLLAAALADADAVVPLTVLQVPIAELVARAFGAVAGTVYLVRPDGHVCGRWRAIGPRTLRTALLRALARHSPEDVQ